MKYSVLLTSAIALATALTPPVQSAPVTQADLDAAFATLRSVAGAPVDQAIKLRAAMPAPTATLTANPASLAAAGSSVLSLSTTYVDVCKPNWGGAFDASGKQTVTVSQSTTYQGDCTGLNGTNVTAKTTITVGQGPPSPISPDGTVLEKGSTGKLVTALGTWTFGTAQGGVWEILLNGKPTRFLTPKMEVAKGGQLYAVGMEGAWWIVTGVGQWTRSSDPNVTTAPKATLTGPSSVQAGKPFDLSWTSNLANCTLSGSATGTYAGNFKVSQTIPNPRTATYNLNCKDPAPSTRAAQAKAVVTATAAPPPPPPPPVSSGDNTMTFTNVSGAIVQSYTYQWGRGFVQGEIPHYPQITLNGTPVPTQADVKNRYPDGSVKYAVLAAMIPTLAVNTPVKFKFQDQATSNNTPLTKDQMLDPKFNFDAKMNLSFASGNQSVSARTMLQSGDYKLWTSGPIAQTIELSDDTAARKYDLGSGDGFHPFRPRFYATFWPATNQVTVRYVGENGLTTEVEDIAYKLSLTLGNTNPSTVYSIDLTGTQAPPKKHWALSSWTKVFWTGNAPEQKININHNLSYLRSTRVFPNFDTSVTISPDVINKWYGYWASKPNDIYDAGMWESGMGTTGGRADIAPYPVWPVLWMYTGDWRMRTVALGQSDLASAWPLNLRESDPGRRFSRDDPAGSSTGLGRPVSISGRPGLYTGNFQYGGTPESSKIKPVGPTKYYTGWYPDAAHEPSPFYPQYILTGDPYYLNMMYSWAGFDAARYQWAGNWEIGMICDQVRGNGWILRNRSETAFAAPDNTPEKRYFTYLTNDALANWESGFKITGTPFDGTVSKKGNSCFGGNIPLLHEWETNTAGGTVSAPGTEIINDEGTRYQPGVVGSMTSPWMHWYLLYALGRTQELGFAALPVFSYTGGMLIGMVTLSGHPEMVDIYRVPVEKRGGGFIPSWPEVAAALTPSYLTKTATRLASPINGELYVEYVKGGAAMLKDTNVSGASATWDWLKPVYGRVTTWNKEQAVWNIEPRTDKNVLPPIPPVIPPLLP